MAQSNLRIGQMAGECTRITIAMVLLHYMTTILVAEITNVQGQVLQNNVQVRAVKFSNQSSMPMVATDSQRITSY